ncbi:MAG: hypothetical protein GC181_00895 [Bacteroidetes bacterium]|nr:hypothetical protein [Bacteroidota bacterium]
MVEESSEINSASNHGVFVTKGFVRGGIAANIMLVVGISMSVMFMLFWLSLNVIVVTVLFIGIVYGLIYLLTGKTVYILEDGGIRRQITPNWKKLKPGEQFYPWSEVMSYVRGDDMNRGKQRYNYLNIFVKSAPGKLTLSDDKSDKIAFAEWADAFEKIAANPDVVVHDVINQKETHTGISQPEEQPHEASALPTKPENQVATKRGAIKKEKTFYEKPIAKILTIVFIVFCGFFINWALTNGMSSTNIFRLTVIVIPGTLYMIYRVFYRKNNS